MYEKIREFIERNDLIPPGSPVVVGVSGGADSLCLLDCLYKLGFPVIAGHLDHQLRPQSEEDARFVAQVCESYGIPFEKQVVDIGKGARSGRSVEERGRLARYNFLTRVAEHHKADHIAVGHTADDQVETVLMHLLRGTGPSGLQGMLPSTLLTEWLGIDSNVGLRLVRPLLDSTHDETNTHCAHLGLVPLEDPSNRDLSFKRNRIRHELLPLLETYNPQVRRVITSLSEVMQQQIDFNKDRLAKHWGQTIKQVDGNGLLIDRAAFRALHPTMQRTLIRSAIRLVAPTLRDISHQATLRAASWLAEGRSGAPSSLPGGLLLESHGEDALLRSSDGALETGRHPQLPAGDQLKLDIPGEVSLASGWRISASVLINSPQSRQAWFSNIDHSLAVFCASELSGSLAVRSRSSGDRIKLPSVGGTTLVADLMINRKIPRLARDQWPLVLTGSDIVWIPGIQRAEYGLLKPASTRVIVLEMHAPEEVIDVATAIQSLDRK